MLTWVNQKLTGEIKFSLNNSAHNRNGLKKSHISHHIDFAAIGIDQQPEESFGSPFIAPYVHFFDNAGEEGKRNDLAVFAVISRHCSMAQRHK